MGQKVNPHGLRVGVIKNWDSRWFAEKGTFGDTLVEDYNVRNFILKELNTRSKNPADKCVYAGVPKVEIERFADKDGGQKVRIHIHCAKPGIVIGRGGAEIARAETYHEGTIPLQTIRADIDYGTAEAHTTYGRIGVKVWIYRGEVLKGEVAASDKRESNDRRRQNRNGKRDFNKAKKEGGNK